MPLIYQHRIYRDDLKNNPDILYIFGDNLMREGLGGQAGQMRGEPNAVGVATKKKPSMSEDSFFSDEEYTDNLITLSTDLQKIWDHLDDGGIVVFPSDGIGTGLSELPIRAPKTNYFLEKQLLNMAGIYGTR